MRTAVISFLNVTSGRYRWWDEFPTLITDHLRRRGIDHICFYRDYDQRSPQETRHPTPEGSLANASWLKQHVRPIAATYDRVIFHTHGHYRPITLWSEVKHHTAARWFWTEHQISEPRRFDLLRKMARCVGQSRGRFPTRLFGVSEAGAVRLRQQFRASSVGCIRTGIRVEQRGARSRVANGDVPRRALFVGRLIPAKGIWPLLDAMVLLRHRGADLHLTIVGRGMSGEVDRFIVANGLSGRVTLAGHQLDVEPYYRAADFVVIPTLVREALGMVSLEARMHGLPAIYANRGGLPETQVEGVTGLNLRAVTAESIADAVVALQADPVRYAAMCSQAPIGLDDFSIEHMVDAYVAEYELAFASMPSRGPATQGVRTSPPRQRAIAAATLQPSEPH